MPRKTRCRFIGGYPDCWRFTPEDAPEARFALLDGEEIISALAYCNLHGLWEGFPEK